MSTMPGQITSYLQGELVDFPITIINQETGELTDPSELEFNFTCGNWGPVKFTWDGTADTPDTDTIWRLSVGVFVTRVDTSPMYGTFNGWAISKGAGQAVGKIQVQIIQTPVLP